MNVKIQKSKARGTLFAPPSKSMAHRMLIAAALCHGESRISGISVCEDVLATIDCLTALGAKCAFDGTDVVVVGADMKKSEPKEVLECRESGSTLRFMLPIAMLSDNEATFHGAKRLMERPMAIYEEICEKKNFRYARVGDTITVKGRFQGGTIELPGNVSSQFITGLLYALSVTGEDSRIIITTEIESKSYIELTRSAMAAFGVKVIWENERTLFIKGGQKYCARDISVEGDYSGSAFLEAFNLFDGEVKVLGLSDESLQGDRVYREHFPRLKDGFCTVNIEDCPDLGPILFAVAAGLHGGEFVGTRRLKIKESDRAEAMAEELRKFGAEVEVFENSVTVKKSSLHVPCETLSGHNDHRIVMSLAVLASLFGGEITEAETVKKSYPAFFDDIKKLGIKFETYEI